MGRCAEERRRLPHLPGSDDGSVVSGRRVRLMYVELHAASAFSFLDGASLAEALLGRAALLGYRALALLDRDGVYGAPRFHLAAKKAGLKAIIGAELTLSASDVPSATGHRSSAIGHRPSDSIFRLP